MSTQEVIMGTDSGWRGSVDAGGLEGILEEVGSAVPGLAGCTGQSGPILVPPCCFQCSRHALLTSLPTPESPYPFSLLTQILTTPPKRAKSCPSICPSKLLWPHVGFRLRTTQGSHSFVL